MAPFKDNPGSSLTSLGKGFLKEIEEFWGKKICGGVEACRSLKNYGVCVVLHWSDEVQITGHSCSHKLGLSIRC